MNALTIVGGLYREKCTFPMWDRVFGSGGRAAAAIAGHVRDITLRTYASNGLVRRFHPEAPDVHVRNMLVEQELSFTYTHSLSTPSIHPALARIHVHDPIDVTADCVLRFGMLEGHGHVNAGRCVYDPQSAFDPEPFDRNGSRANHLAIVGNRFEVRHLGQNSDVGEAAKRLVREGAECVVVKRGIDGADVWTANHVERISPYESENVWSVGSGDVFSAVFAVSWAVHGASPVEAARLASSAVASYADTRALPVPPTDKLRSRTDCAKAHRGRAYLAAPFFTLGQRHLVDEVRRLLSEFGIDVFSPVHDVGVGPADEVAPADIAGLQESDVVFAILDGLDSGTLFEVGYARALGKPVYALAQDVSSNDLKMIEGTGCSLYYDLVTAVHHLAWRR